MSRKFSTSIRKQRTFKFKLLKLLFFLTIFSLFIFLLTINISSKKKFIITKSTYKNLKTKGYPVELNEYLKIIENVKFKKEIEFKKALQVLFLNKKNFEKFIPEIIKLSQNSKNELQSTIETTNTSISKKQNPLKTIRINIKDKHFLKIQKIVKKHKDKLILRERKYFPAVIENKNKLIPIKIRLKGDWTDHLTRDKKWSFRVKILEKNALMGMKVFSLQHPATRNWLYEWLFIKILRNNDILAPRYKYVNLVINDENWGIYNIEEFFSKELLENQKRRESVIMKFSEDELWDIWAGNLPEVTGFHKAAIKTFRSKKVFKNPKLKSLFSAAFNKLDRYRKGKIKASNVFDYKLLAKYLAFSDIFQAHHGSAIYHNLRFYYNPITGLFEPIHFDGNAGKFAHSRLSAFLPFEKYQEDLKIQRNGLYIYKPLFDDPVFFETYLKELKTLSEKNYINKIKDDYEKYVGLKINLLKKEWPSVEYNWSQLSENAAIIHSYWARYAPESTLQIKGSKKSLRNNVLKISITNQRKLPIEIVSINYKYIKNNIPLKVLKTNTKKHYNNESFMVPGNHKHTRFYFMNLKIPSFLNKNSLKTYKIKLGFRVLGGKKIYYKYLTPVSDDSRLGAPDPNISIKKVLRKHKFLILRSKTNLKIKRGSWQVNGDIIIPRGYTLTINSGTKLFFNNKAVFLSYSSVTFLGKKNSPILMSAKGKSWGGFITIKANERSYLKYVIFENSEGFHRTGWNSSGGVTFYNSPVDIEYSKFKDSKGEDALNIIKSSFNISNCHFKNIYSDAFDSDFSNGVISDTKLEKIKGDALDFSGSNVKINRVWIQRIRDKAISAGENSRIVARNAKIESVNIAFASKDQSNLNIYSSSIFNAKIAFTAFQKKPEFGPASINAFNIYRKKIKTHFLIEKNSEMTLDQKSIESNVVNLKKKLYE